MVAEDGIPGGVESGAPVLAHHRVEVVLDLGESDRLVAVAQGELRVIEQRVAVVLNALPFGWRARVRHDRAAVHDREKPVHLDRLVVVGVVAGRDDAVERAAAERSGPQLVDALHELGCGLGAEGLVRAERRIVGLDHELEAHGRLRVDDVQVGELYDRGERGAGGVAAGLRRGEILAAAAGTRVPPSAARSRPWWSGSPRARGWSRPCRRPGIPWC